MTTHQKRMGVIGLAARAASLVVLTYWAGFALLSPVTVWDSHVYNLGRIPIAELQGFFGNTLWTSERQLAFPWGFDAIHLPLLHLGWAYALPSFLCLVGTLAVVWSFLTDRYGLEAGWIGVLALLSLPVLVFQSVVTKNDVAVLFGAAAWFHAVRLWRHDHRACHLAFAALAIGFTAGAKTSGLLPVGFCSLITLWVIRSSIKRMLIFCGTTAVSLFLLGSVETYFESYRQYNYALGPRVFVQAHRNNAGIRGDAANALRYAFGATNLGFEIWQSPDRVTPWLERICRGTLSRLALTNCGNRSDHDDHDLSFIKHGWDANSDFGPLGTACLGMLALTLVWWRPQDDWWRLGVFAGLMLYGVCHSVAWMPWNNRFLLLPFSLLTVALVSLIYRHGGSRRWPVVVLVVVATYSAVVYPLTSFNKRPTDLVAALWHRDAQMFKERPSMLPVLAAARAWGESHPNGILHLVAGSDSWVLPFFYLPNLHVDIVPLAQVSHVISEAGENGRPEALLVLNRSDFSALDLPLRELGRFADEPGTFLLEPLPKGSAAAPALSRESGFFGDGWTADKFTIGVQNWPETLLHLEFYNPTPLARTILLKSSTGETRVTLAPNERALATLQVDKRDRVVVTVTPTFVPKQVTGAPDDRKLGVWLTFPPPVAR